MAVGESYPARFSDSSGVARLDGTLTFEDSSDQPTPPGAVITVAEINAEASTIHQVIASDGAGAAVWEAQRVLSVFTRTGAVVATAGDYAVADVTGAAALASPTFTGTVTVPAAAVVNAAPRISQLTSALTITAGALPALAAWASGTAQQNAVARQVTVCVEVVTDGTANAATCAIAISPDNTTYTTIATPGASAAVNTVGAITELASVILPAAWWIKLTFSHCTIAASKYY